MTVKKFTDRLWYITPFAVISEKTSVEDLYTAERVKEKALWSGDAMESESSDTFMAVADLEVKRYGIVDNTLLIEV